MLVGEDKFRGGKYGKFGCTSVPIPFSLVDYITTSFVYTAQAWFRSVTHYMFLADPRTARIIGEPNAGNPAIIKMSIDGGMSIQTVRP